jgi:predicted DNA binding CopG/RHH family protein
MKKPIPKFKNEAEEFEFWSSTGPGADSTKYIDWSQAKRAKFPNLRPTLRTISVRLPVAMIEDLKILANQRDVPYQSLLKVFLGEIGSAASRVADWLARISHMRREPVAPVS